MSAGRMVALSVVAVAMAAAVAHARKGPRRPPAPSVMPGPARRAAPAAHHEAQADCERCHRHQAATWRESLHKHSFDNPVFTEANARKPEPFCQGCHAPMSDPRSEVSEIEAHTGVGCVTCHGAGDRVLSASDSTGQAPHGLLIEPRFASADACARCHEFEFPDRELRPRAELMQKTVSEHRESPFADTTCTDCHMPWQTAPDGRRYRAHDFSIIGEPDRIREAVTVVASRPTAQTVRLELATRGVGHAVPTGDMFRRIVVRARAVGTAEWTDVVYLGREFRLRRPLGDRVPVEVADNRLTEEPRTVELAVGRGAAEYEVVYQRIIVSPLQRPERARVAEEILLERGTLPASEPS